MRVFSICLILFVAILLITSSVFAEEDFNKFNSDLKRIGLEEILKMSKIGFESGNYRLDSDFTLGFGDTVTLNFWGKIKANYTLKIDREGNIVIPFLGKINIIDFTLEAARQAVKKELDRKYTNVEFDLNLSDVQNIRITVLGNVQSPGPYAVSPFCRLVGGVAKSGGPNSNGSLIDIRLIRNDKQIVSFDVYDFIFKGDESKNVRLKHGDKIYIPQVKKLIAVKGELRYPGVYEVKKGAKLSQIIETAGGMLPSSLRRKIYIIRSNVKNKRMEVSREIILKDSQSIKAGDDIALEHNDTIIVTTAFDSVLCAEDLFKVVHLTGKVRMPGDYLIKEGETLSSLIKRAEGLKSNAFTEGAIFTRDSLKQIHRAILDGSLRQQERSILEQEAFLMEAILTEEERKMRQKAIECRRKALNIMASHLPNGRIALDLEEVIEGKSDIFLQKGDKISIPSIPDWVLITGAVYNPQAVIYKKGESWEYYLNSAGGPDKFADSDNIYIIKASGQVNSRHTGYKTINRGDIIVVPAKME